MVIDDNLSIHEDFRKIFQPGTETQGLDEARASLFGGESFQKALVRLELDYADQGQAALALVQMARREERPYAVAFVDMRMLPGWDGLETIERMWEVDPEIQTVVCTAYSDQPWGEIRERIGRTDKLLILQKPFNGIEALQLATALCWKWDLADKAVGRLHE